MSGTSLTTAASGRSRAVLLGSVVALGSLGVAGAALLATQGGGPPAATAAAAAGEPSATAPAVVPAPRATVRGVRAGRIAWDRPLGVSAVQGTLTAVVATDQESRAVPGTVGADGVWRSTGTLVPSSTYRLQAQVRDRAGAVRTLPLTTRTTAAGRTLEPSLLSPHDAVVGVGQPVRVVLDRPVTDEAVRAAVVKRLAVQAQPRTTGAWRWMSDTELHYRPATFWKPGTAVSLTVDLDRLDAGGGIWGSGKRTASFRVGDANISTVDVAAKTMTVARNGKVLRVMPASMGKPGFATRRGTFLVLEKFEDKVMDSDTLALPAGEQAYRTKVKHAVRITNSGTFTHGAPWSLSAQGRRNVSHGCINLSPENARWYYEQVRRGDVVQVVNSPVGPTSWDAGSRDWNMSFAEWRRGT